MSAYHRPTTLAESLEVLTEHPVQIVAGATDVYPSRVAGQVWGDSIPHQPKAWMDISAIAGLDSLTDSAEEWRIGPMVSWAALQQADLPPAFDALKSAGLAVGGLQIQNRATLAGNLCNASPAADGVPPLLCLDAEIELSSLRGVRRLALKDFILGNRQTARQSDELLSAICISKKGATGSTTSQSRFYKLGARKYLVISIVMVAIVIDIDAAGSVGECRIAVGSCSPVAIRLHELERALIGLPVIDPLSENVRPSHFDKLAPLDDIRSDAEYRLHAAREAVIELLASVSHPGAEFA